MMHSCGEANFPKNKGKIWTCRFDSYFLPHGTEVVMLEGYSGAFSCKCLEAVKPPFHIKTREEQALKAEFNALTEETKVMLKDPNAREVCECGACSKEETFTCLTCELEVGYCLGYEATGVSRAYNQICTSCWFEIQHQLYPPKGFSDLSMGKELLRQQHSAKAAPVFISIPWVSIEQSLPEEHKELIVADKAEPWFLRTKKLLVMTEIGSVIDSIRLKSQAGKKEWIWHGGFQGEQVVRWVALV